jgi:DNA-binding response OmpR family regulator
MISADATSAQIERLRAAGASDYLTKPIDVRKFLTLVDATEPRTARHAPQPSALKVPEPTPMRTMVHDAGPARA